jgi:hypothetical protein
MPIGTPFVLGEAEDLTDAAFAKHGASTAASHRSRERQSENLSSASVGKSSMLC